MSLQKLADGMKARADEIGDNDTSASNAYMDCAGRVEQYMSENEQPPKLSQRTLSVAEDTVPEGVWDKV